MAAQFARTLEREADFVTETRNIERFAKNFAGDPNVVIPRIYPEYTSDVLLVQEHVDGIPATAPRGSRPPASTARCWRHAGSMHSSR